LRPFAGFNKIHITYQQKEEKLKEHKVKKSANVETIKL
jgi:hypothetical protein